MGLYQDHCTYLPAMLGWFFFSAALTSYNKYIFGSGHTGFPCPLFMTSIHFSVQWIFSYTATMMYPDTHGNSNILKMPWIKYLIVSVPCGLVTCGDVGLSNMALVRINISFYTMIKASSPVFVLFFAFLLQLEKVRCSLIVVVLIISLGEYITVIGEDINTFDKRGFLYCLGASVLSGLRWTLVQNQLSTIDPPLKTTLATMRLLSPTMFLGMLILSFIIEKPWIALSPSSGVDYFINFTHGIETLGLGVFGASIAICMVLCEFYLIMNSNAIILMIGGVLKELVSISVGVVLFKDKLSLINGLGFVIVFLGIITYKIVLHMQKMEEKERGADVDYEPMKVEMKNKKNIKKGLIDTNDALNENSEDIDDFLLEEDMKKEEPENSLESNRSSTDEGHASFGDLELAQENNASQISRLRMDLSDETEFELLNGAQMT